MCSDQHATSALRMQVITLGGELLDKAGGLLREGLTTTEVADGYQLAGEKVRGKSYGATCTEVHPSVLCMHVLCKSMLAI